MDGYAACGRMMYGSLSWALFMYAARATLSSMAGNSAGPFDQPSRAAGFIDGLSVCSSVRLRQWRTSRPHDQMRSRGNTSTFNQVVNTGPMQLVALVIPATD